MTNLTSALATTRSVDGGAFTASLNAQSLGPWSGVYHPDYQIQMFKNGDPGSPITSVNFRTITQITTNKNLDNISGTFQITLKDRRAENQVGPMDVAVIHLKGHNQGWGKVWVGAVDTVEPSGNAQTTSAEADVTISGRCTGKYLQINSMFLPVWDPAADLPTALIFGIGAVQGGLGDKIAGQNNVKDLIYPRTIFGYIFDHYVVGTRNLVGVSGTPNARYWLGYKNRFEWVRDSSSPSSPLFKVPYIQFDENTCDTALTSLTVQGFTEGWVDEKGNVVYRRPQWDAPISWNLNTKGLKDWDLPASDDTLSTYVEVFPGALPGISAGIAQAMYAGRAPIPSNYAAALKNSGTLTAPSAEFVIDTDSNGKVTAQGARNYYYQKQKKYGVRPYQITSSLLGSQQQAQAQAEGLLEFLLRWDKSGTIDIPGEPNITLGTTLYLTGPLDDQMLARTYYIQGISHTYIEGQSYTTTLTLTHGRDPGDPKWQSMVMPNLTPAQLAAYGGIGQRQSTNPSGDTAFPIPADITGIRRAIVQAAYQAHAMPASDWKYPPGDNRPPTPAPAAVTSWDSIPKPINTDCSGFVTLDYKIAGAPDPNGDNYSWLGDTGAMEANGQATTNPQPGDLAFWSDPDHVAVYVGNGNIIEHGATPITLSTVTAENAYHASFLGYRTYL